MFIKYFVLSILTLLILIFWNILLLNEETLILICFISFLWLFNINVGGSIKNEFEVRRNKIKISLNSSLQNIIFNLINLLKLKNRFWNLFFSFKLLTHYYLKLVNLIFDWSNTHTKQVLKEPFPKRFHFIYRLENQVTKLLLLILVKRLERIVNLRAYFTYILQNPHFVCLYKINIREYIQSIKV